MFFLIERKSAMRPEASKGLRSNTALMPGEPPSWDRDYGYKRKLTSAMDTDAALSGADIWREEYAKGFVGVSGRLKCAMEAAGMKTLLLKEIRSVKLV